MTTEAAPTTEKPPRMNDKSFFVSPCLRVSVVGVLSPRLRFLHFFRQHRDDVEQISDNPVIGELEDPRLGIFINGDDRSRALPAPQLLSLAADAHPHSAC